MPVVKMEQTCMPDLFEPLAYPFMLRGLIAVMLVGVVSAVVGTYVVLRGMAFLGDALAHAILPGVAVGYLTGGGAHAPVLLGALVAAVLASVGIGAISKGARIREDTSIGVIFAGMLALGIALISSVRSYTTDLTHFLFGNVLGVSDDDLWLTLIVGGAIVLIVFLFYKEFLVLSFDPILAATLRLPARLLENLLLVLIAVAIVIALQTVGVGLMVAMLVTPAATAYLLTRRLPLMMLLAAASASLSGVVGLYVSYYRNIASGAAIVLTATGVFLLVFFFAPRRGVVWNTLRQRRA
jgi:ABC-type Mn2+/Zn2+ transport system permease subunit